MTLASSRPCERCTGECCKAYIVGLCGYDVWTIATALRLEPTQFAVVITEESPSPSGFRLDASPTTHSLILAKKQTEAEERIPCTFLMELPGGNGRCGIYPHRPLACRNYPAYLHRGSVAIRENIECAPGSWNLTTLDMPAWRSELLRSQMEWGIYATVVQRWNGEMIGGRHRAGGDAFERYCGYVMDAYRRLDALRRETGEAELARIAQRWGQRSARESGEDSWRGFLARAERVVHQAGI